jgi:F0F1-type ATP synthase delta subunit
MIPEDMYKELLEDINTTEESVTCIHQLDDLGNSLFVKKTSFDEKLDLYLENNFRNKLVTVIEKLKLDVNDPGKIEKFITEIREKLKELPIMRLDLAFEPTASIINHISEWIGHNLEQKVLLDINPDHTLVAGAIIGFNGKMVDLTLKHRIEKEYINLLDLKNK